MASEVTIKQGPDKYKMMLGLFEHAPVIFTDNDGRKTRLGIRAIFHHRMIVHGTLLDHAEEFREVDADSVWLIHGHIVDEDGDNFLDEDEKDGKRTQTEHPVYIVYSTENQRGFMKTFSIQHDHKGNITTEPEEHDLMYLWLENSRRGY